MADTLELVIVTPERQLLRQAAKEVELPGADGYLGVLPGHAPLITELGIGELIYKSESGESHFLAIIRGFAEVLPDRVSVLAETAERPAEIDVERAKAALKRAQERLASNDPSLDWDRALLSMQRALIRIRVAELHLKHRNVTAAETHS